MEIEKIKKKLDKKKKKLLDKSNVVATGIGYKVTAGKKTSVLSIICSVIEKRPVSKLSNKDIIPKFINDIPTDVIQVGKITALHTNRHRPAPGGVSIGHKDITAGTLGCWMSKDNNPVILSNNHVLANSNDAFIGDEILQPGPHDGGSLTKDHIADLLKFVPISFGNILSNCPLGGSIVGVFNFLAWFFGRKTRLIPIVPSGADNLVDAAVALPLNFNDVDKNIMDIGAINGIGKAGLGMSIKKSGRTTGLTLSTVDQIDVTVDVGYGGLKTAVFVDQIIAGDMCKGGDSGSVVLDNDNNLIGLLFAGGDGITVINRIEHVVDLLKLTL